MDLRTFFVRKTIGFFILVPIIILGYYVFQNQTVEKPQVTEVMTDSQPYRTTLIGEYTCLPLADSVLPEPETCQPGLYTDTNEYYAIDFYLMSQTPEPVRFGDRISANGVVTPIERLSTDHWRKYRVVAIFSVTDSLSILK